MNERTKKILLVLIVLAAIVATRFSGVLDHVTLEALKKQGQASREIVAGHYAFSVLVYMVGYALAVALSVPGDIVLSVAGGYLFGTFLGAFYINVGATTGALLSFLFFHRQADTALPVCVVQPALGAEWGPCENLPLDYFSRDNSRVAYLYVC